MRKHKKGMDMEIRDRETDMRRKMKMARIRRSEGR
jgi:hypothetical protein